VAPETVPFGARRFCVWTAAASGGVLLLATLLVFSPWLRIRTVSWTGPLRLGEPNYRTLETASLGRPLFLVSENALGRSLGLDPHTVRFALHRHLPATLEVSLTPRRAIAVLDEGTPVDGGGRRLASEHALPGLPRLIGFELEPNGKRLQSRGRTVLAAFARLLDLPTLTPSEIRLEQAEIDLVLADTGTRVRLDPAALAPGLTKLRVFEQSLGQDPMPACIDLRFQDQVVVREKGTGNASRRPR
jgi:cell division septal protein FtsQ